MSAAPDRTLAEFDIETLAMLVEHLEARIRVLELEARERRSGRIAALFVDVRNALGWGAHVWGAR